MAGTPDTVQFTNNPIEGTQAESELVIFRSELPSYNPANNKFIRINLPVADKGWIDFSDTVLSLKFTNRSYQTASNDATKSGVKTQLSNLIKSVTVLNSNAEQVEYVNNYNLISSIMDDLSMGGEHKKSVEQVLANGSPDGNPANTVVLAGNGTGTTEANGASLTMCDRLMTGFTSGQFLLPLGYLVGQAPAIILELEDADTALAITTDTNGKNAYQVENVELRAKQIRFNAMFNASFEKTLAEQGAKGVNYITETYLSNQGTVPSGTTGQYNVPFSCNPRSAKYILACHRLESDITNIGKYSINNRGAMEISQYNWEISGKMHPAQPITVDATNFCNSYAQVLDCMGQIGAINRNTLVTKDTTGTLWYDIDETKYCKFLSGLVLEDFNSATNPSIYSGTSLQTVGQLTYRPTIASSKTLSGAYRVDFITCIDTSFHFTIDGRMYSVK
jgi:hypothetical protein